MRTTVDRQPATPDSTALLRIERRYSCISSLLGAHLSRKVKNGGVDNVRMGTLLASARGQNHQAGRRTEKRLGSAGAGRDVTAGGSQAGEHEDFQGASWAWTLQDQVCIPSLSPGGEQELGRRKSCPVHQSSHIPR